jgi:hypothetical protein
MPRWSPHQAAQASRGISKAPEERLDIVVPNSNLTEGYIL